jgi:hypothetical protein
VPSHSYALSPQGGLIFSSSLLLSLAPFAVDAREKPRQWQPTERPAGPAAACTRCRGASSQKMSVRNRAYAEGLSAPLVS